MAKVIIFVTGLSKSFNRENRDFEKKVRSFSRLMLGKSLSIAKYCKGEDYNSIFGRNADCQFVFTKSTDLESQLEAKKRGLMVFELQPQNTLWPVERVTRVNHRGYKKIPYGI